MSHSWNEALAAYDRELPLLRALRDEYLAYLHERFAAAKSAVASDVTSVATIEVSQVGEPDAGVEILLAGEGAASTLQCQLWSSADKGGETGALHWAVVVASKLPAEFGDTRHAVKVARSASSAVPTEALEQAPEAVRAFPGFDVVRWGRVDIAAPDLASRLTQLMRQLVTAMNAAALAMLELRKATPRYWLQQEVCSSSAMDALSAAGAADVQGRPWPSVGYHLVVRIPGADRCYFTARDDGGLSFHWDSGPDKAARRAGALTALGDHLPHRQDGYDGVMLAGPAVVAQWFEGRRADAVHALMRTTWTRYRDLHLRLTAGS